MLSVFRGSNYRMESTLLQMLNLATKTVGLEQRVPTADVSRPASVQLQDFPNNSSGRWSKVIHEWCQQGHIHTIQLSKSLDHCTVHNKGLSTL